MPRHTLEGFPKRRRTQGEFSASLMSDTKWHKLFDALDDPARLLDLELGQAIVKFIDVDDERVIATPKCGGLRLPNPFVDTIEFGPIRLRDIEWIEFPKIARYSNPSPNGTGTVPAKLVEQDIVMLEAHLTTRGKFPVERTERGLRINGYVRQTKAP